MFPGRLLRDQTPGLWHEKLSRVTNNVTAQLLRTKQIYLPNRSLRTAG